METTQHQEWRARQRISVPAILKAAFATGLLFFIMSGGSPWSTAGTMNAIMGRDIAMSWPLLIIAHFGLATLYTAVIAAGIYRFRTPVAVPLGIGITLALYGINFVLFRGMGGTMQSPEFRAFFVHLVFGLFASLLYKAMSVPKPLPA